jgi:hypothetical protein
LDGQVALRRAERFSKHTINDIVDIPTDHRARSNYKMAQYAPGDYEAIISQRPIAIHALENPTKFDAGPYLFRKMLRDAIRGSNPAASAEAFAEWLQGLGGAPNSYCSGNVFELPIGATTEEEVAQRRFVAKSVITILTESEQYTGKERTAFVKQKMEELEQTAKAQFKH